VLCPRGRHMSLLEKKAHASSVGDEAQVPVKERKKILFGEETRGCIVMKRV
jgi:hypothetical protein